MESFCGASCKECNLKVKCLGCIVSNGNPFGGGCTAAGYIRIGGQESYNLFKSQIIDEINALGIEGMERVENLYSVCGFSVNHEYNLPGGNALKFLDDKHVYLSNRIPNMFDDKSYYLVVADMDFILVSNCLEHSDTGEIIIYKRR